jgi:hypothetical protein
VVKNPKKITAFELRELEERGLLTSEGKLFSPAFGEFLKETAAD